jgi:hypothetical protein
MYNRIMKRDALLSFKTSQEMREAVEKLAKEGDRSVSMQLNKILREWFEEHAPQSPTPNKPQKTGRA